MKLPLHLIAIPLLLASCTPPTASPDASNDGVAATDGGGQPVDGAAAEDTCTTANPPHSWPAAPQPPVICSDKTPLLLPVGVGSNAAGGVRLESSGLLQPVGELEKVTVQLLTTVGTPHASPAGELVVSAPAAVEIVSKTPVSEGAAVITLRVKELGSHDISAQLKGDKRTGTLRLHGYKTQLSIWRLDVTDADLQKLYLETEKRLWIDGKLHVNGEVHIARIRLHGGSSRSDPKKSLRINLVGSTLDDGADAIILRAEWRDKTGLRLLLAATVLKELAGLPFPELTPIHLRRLGGEYMGLMIRAERLGPAYLKKRGRDPNGDLYEADPPHDLSIPGGNLTPQPDVSTYAKVYQHHGGVNGYAPLIQLIEGTLQETGEALYTALSSGFQLDALFAYMAAMAAIQNHDHIKKNFYLYRDSDGPDCRWEMLGWDLDLSFGHLWNPQQELLGEAIISDGNPLVGLKTDNLFYNQLVDKVLSHPPWLAQYKAALGKVMALFDEVFVAQHAKYWLCVLGSDLLADRHKRADNAELSGRVDELVAFAKARRAFLKTWVAP